MEAKGKPVATAPGMLANAGPLGLEELQVFPEGKKPQSQAPFDTDTREDSARPFTVVP